MERLDAGVVEAPSRVRGSRRDPATGMINPEGIRQASWAISAAVADVLASESRPLVVGGDCAILIGVFLGLPEETGLWFVDGHADFFDGQTSPTGEAADMDLAILTGRAVPGLLRRAQPLVRSESVVLLGHRPADLGEDAATEHALLDPAIEAHTSVEVRDRGAGSVAQEIAARDPSRGRWLHIDLDVLDEVALPAVSYPQPMGLEWEDLLALVPPLAAAEGLTGVSVTDFNPDFDPHGHHAKTITEVLGALLA